MADESIGREIRQLRNDMEKWLARLELADTGLLRQDVYNAHREAFIRRLDTIEAKVGAQDVKIESIEKDRQETWRKRVSIYAFPAITLLAFILFQFWKP